MSPKRFLGLAMLALPIGVLLAIDVNKFLTEPLSAKAWLCGIGMFMAGFIYVLLAFWLIRTSK